MDLNPLKSELLTKQACRDELVVYSLFFSPTTYTSLYLYVLSTFLRISNLTLDTQAFFVNNRGFNAENNHRLYTKYKIYLTKVAVIRIRMIS